MFICYISDMYLAFIWPFTPDSVYSFWMEISYVTLWIGTYGAFRLLSLCIDRRLPTLVFHVATPITRKNVRNAQSCCERLASADVDRGTAMKSE